MTTRLAASAGGILRSVRNTTKVLRILSVLVRKKKARAGWRLEAPVARGLRGSEGDRRERERVSEPTQSQTVRSGVDGRVVGRTRSQMAMMSSQWAAKRVLEMRVPDELRWEILTVES